MYIKNKELRDLALVLERIEYQVSRLEPSQRTVKIKEDLYIIARWLFEKFCK